MCNENNVTQVATEILDYLKKHPMASDTLGGIAQWWLTRQIISNHLNLVEAALDDLVQQGLLGIRENEDTALLYFLKKKN